MNYNASELKVMNNTGQRRNNYLANVGHAVRKSVIDYGVIIQPRQRKFWVKYAYKRRLYYIEADIYGYCSIDMMWQRCYELLVEDSKIAKEMFDSAITRGPLNTMVYDYKGILFDFKRANLNATLNEDKGPTRSDLAAYVNAAKDSAMTGEKLAPPDGGWRTRQFDQSTTKARVQMSDVAGFERKQRKG